MPETIDQTAGAVRLSEAALALLKLHGERDDMGVDDLNREPYRELEAAGLVLLSRPFTGPRVYRLTKVGWKLIDVLERMNANVPLHGAPAAPRL
jgi:hypothetical protein